MYSNVIEVTFDSAHRLYDYEGKCHNLHGHTYTAIITLKSATLRGTGFVVDFGEIKKWLKEWLDAYWDHATVLKYDDPLIRALGPYTKIYSMEKEPTAENMAEALFMEVREKMLSYEGVWVSSVGIKETPTTTAFYTA